MDQITIETERFITIIRKYITGSGTPVAFPKDKSRQLLNLQYLKTKEAYHGYRNTRR